MSALLARFHAFERFLARPAGCDSFDPALCRCRGRSAAHPVVALLSIARTLRQIRRGPSSGVRIAAEEYATIPPGLTLGDGLLRTVRCYVCGRVLRPGKAGPVTRERAGRWRDGRASGSCGAVAKVPRGVDGLERALRSSLEVSR